MTTAVEESLGTIRTLISNYEKRAADDALVDELADGQSHAVTRRASYAVVRGDRRALLADLNSWATTALQRQEPSEEDAASSPPGSAAASAVQAGLPVHEGEAMSHRLRRVVAAFRALGARLMELAARYEDTTGATVSLSTDAQHRVELDALKLERALLLAQCTAEDYAAARDGPVDGGQQPQQRNGQVVERIPPELIEAHETLVSKLEDQVVQLKSRNAYLASELDEMHTMTAAFKVERELMLGASTRVQLTEEAETWTGDEVQMRSRGVGTSDPQLPAAGSGEESEIATSMNNQLAISVNAPPLDASSSTLRGPRRAGTPQGAASRRSTDQAGDMWRGKFRFMQLLFLGLRFVTKSKRQTLQLTAQSPTRPLEAAGQDDATCVSIPPAKLLDGEARQKPVIPTRKLASAALPRQSGSDSMNGLGLGTLIQVNEHETAPEPATPELPASADAAAKQPAKETPKRKVSPVRRRESPPKEVKVAVPIVRPGGAIKSTPTKAPAAPAPAGDAAARPAPSVAVRPRKITHDVGVNPDPPEISPQRGYADAAVNTPHSATWQHQAKQHFSPVKKATSMQTQTYQEELEPPQEAGEAAAAAAAGDSAHWDEGEGLHHYHSLGAIAVADVRPTACPLPYPSGGSRGEAPNARIHAFPIREGGETKRRPHSAQTPSSIPRSPRAPAEASEILVACGLNIPLPYTVTAAASVTEASPLLPTGVAGLSLPTAALAGPVATCSSHHFSTVRIQTGPVMQQTVEEYLVRTMCVPLKPPTLATAAAASPRQSSHYRLPQHTIGTPGQRPATAGRVPSGAR